MKENSSTDKFIIVSGIILVVALIVFFLIPVVATTMKAKIIIVSLYGILIIASLFLLIKSLLSRKKITKKWIKYFAFLPICVAIVPVLFGLVFEAYKSSILDKQCHELICELKSSELLENGWTEFSTYRVSSKTSTSRNSILFKPRQEDDSYIYDFDNTIYKERERKLILKADNCIAVFLFDIPDTPKPQPFSKWKAPVKIITGKNKKIKLELRYKVIKNEM